MPESERALVAAPNRVELVCAESYVRDHVDKKTYSVLRCQNNTRQGVLVVGGPCKPLAVPTVTHTLGPTKLNPIAIGASLCAVHGSGM